jgi:hypothetical protein
MLMGCLSYAAGTDIYYIFPIFVLNGWCGNATIRHVLPKHEFLYGRWIGYQYLVLFYCSDAYGNG